MTRFGPFELDLRTGELLRDGAKVPLQDKPFQILALLLRRPGELITREALRSELWSADTFVDFEHGLNTAVKKLRQALGDSAESPRFVETLPRRGYRFIAPIDTPDTAAPQLPDRAPVPEELVEGATEKQRSWRGRAVWAAVATVGLVIAASVWPRREPVQTPAPAASPRPVVVLMDSPLPGRVYDPRTFAAGGTNADDITDALQDLPIAIQKENTNAVWHREDQVVRQNPALIVSHLSCLLDARVGEAGHEGPISEHLFELAESRLLLVFGYVAAMNPRTQFLVYSRGAFADASRAKAFVSAAEARLPVLHGRLATLNVPGREQATFRDPHTARLIRERVKSALRLP